MSASTHHYGFRIVGPCDGERKRVEAEHAFRAYCQCDPKAGVDREAYLSAFQFDDDFKDHLAAHGTTRGFNGSTWSPYIWWDIDRDEAAGGIAQALTDTRRLVDCLDDHFGVVRDVLVPFVSGHKGFHVGLPTALWAPPAGTDFHAVARAFAESIAGEAGIAIDTGVYDRVRAFRAPNSRHPKTGLHKRYIEVGILDTITVNGVLDLARTPAPFDLPRLEEFEHTDFLAGAWERASRAVAGREQAKEERRHEVASGTRAASINRQTRLFLNGDVGVGDRHRLLFSAAANCAEVGCNLPACRALLFEPARDMGLPPRDIERGIVNGFESVSNKGGNAE